IKVTPKSPPKSPVEPKTPKTEVNYFDQVVTHASSTKATTAPQKVQGAKKLKKSALIGLAAAVLVLTTYVSVDTWMTNSKIKSSASPDEVAGVSDTVDRRSQEGRDETPPPADYL